MGTGDRLDELLTSTSALHSTGEIKNFLLSAFSTEKKNFRFDVRFLNCLDQAWLSLQGLTQVA